MRVPLLSTLLDKARRSRGWHWAFRGRSGRFVTAKEAARNEDTSSHVKVANPGRGFKE